MAEKFKSQEQINAIAAALKAQRKALGLTFVAIESELGVNRGHLSRLERGDFKSDAPNLQKYRSFLQNHPRATLVNDVGLGTRLEAFAARSPRHRVAVEEILQALERLG